MRVRQTALTLLMREEEGGFANLLLSDSVLARAGEDAGLLTALFYGTVERRLTLDYAIGTLAGREVSSLAPHTRAALRLGLYQIYFTRIPAHAAVSETVALGENAGERGLLNAVLRRATKEPLPLPPGRCTADLSAEFFRGSKLLKFFPALDFALPEAYN